MNSFAPLVYAFNRVRWRIIKPLTVGVRLLLVQQDQVLLVKHTYQKHWFLVGGGVKRDETLEQAACREALEEVGAQLGQLCLFGVYSNFQEYKSDHVVVFSCSDFTITGKHDREIEGYQSFNLRNLPKDVSPGTQRRVAEYLDRRRQPSVATW